MKQIKLDLTVEETNLILEGLGNMPFIKVHELISKLHEQASAQVTDIQQKAGEAPRSENLEVVANEK